MESKIIYILIIGVFQRNFIICTYRKPEDIEYSKQKLPYFRRKVEEIIDDNAPTQQYDDSENHLVSFLIKNVKEVFKEPEDSADIITRKMVTYNNDVLIQYKTIDPKNKQQFESTILFRPTVGEDNTETFSNQSTPYQSDISLTNFRKSMFENVTEMTQTTVPDFINSDKISMIKDLDTPLPFMLNSVTKSEIDIFSDENSSIETTIYSPSVRFPKDLLFLGKEVKGSIDNLEPDNGTEHLFMFTTDFRTEEDTKRSCITCDNVNSIGCSNPKNKLIQSVVCGYEESLCYSQHTPFGIVDRGCFSINHDMTVYVCACNLCNNAPITDMPIIFSSKREWIANVLELSQARRLRNSIYKHMSCLKCEVNNTIGGNIFYNTNCLEGRIPSSQTQVCRDDEICGVKAIKNQGYMWRGCISFPYYNYFMSLCDTDLCNYDRIVSIFDPN